MSTGSKKSVSVNAVRTNRVRSSHVVEIDVGSSSPGRSPDSATALAFALTALLAAGAALTPASRRREKYLGRRP
jgi:hypothetical protein